MIQIAYFAVICHNHPQPICVWVWTCSVGRPMKQTCWMHATWIQKLFFNMPSFWLEALLCDFASPSRAGEKSYSVAINISEWNSWLPQPPPQHHEPRKRTATISLNTSGHQWHTLKPKWFEASALPIVSSWGGPARGNRPPSSFSFFAVALPILLYQSGGPPDFCTRSGHLCHWPPLLWAKITRTGQGRGNVTRMVSNLCNTATPFFKNMKNVSVIKMNKHKYIYIYIYWYLYLYL